MSFGIWLHLEGVESTLSELRFSLKLFIRLTQFRCQRFMTLYRTLWISVESFDHDKTLHHAVHWQADITYCHNSIEGMQCCVHMEKCLKHGAPISLCVLYSLLWVTVWWMETLYSSKHIWVSLVRCFWALINLRVSMVLCVVLCNLISYAYFTEINFDGQRLDLDQLN